MANKWLNILDLTNNKIINVANGTNSLDAVNKSQLDAAIGTLTAALEYKGAFDTSAENFDALLDASKGDFYIVTGDTWTITEGEGEEETVVTEFRNGDHIVVNKDVEGVPTIDDIDLIKNTEFPDMVFESREQTLTNKTISADDNTITDITVEELKSGVLDTDLSSVSESDDTLASAKAIKTYTDGQIVSTLAARVHSSVIAGDDTAVEFVVNHELGTEDVLVQVVDTDTNYVAYPVVELTDADNVKIKFGNAPEVGEDFKVRILALAFPA